MEMFQRTLKQSCTPKPKRSTVRSAKLGHAPTRIDARHHEQPLSPTVSRETSLNATDDTIQPGLTGVAGCMNRPLFVSGYIDTATHIHDVAAVSI